MADPFPVRRLGGALLLLALLAGPAAAVTFGEIEIVPATEPRGQPGHGYTEYRLIVRHKGKDRPHQIRLRVPGSDSPSPRGAIQAVTRTVVVEPGSTVIVSLLVPAHPPTHGSQVAVWIDGRRQEDRVPLSVVVGGRRGAFGGGERLVLLSQRVPENLLSPPPPMPGPPAPPGGGPGAMGPVPGGGGAPPAPGGGPPMPGMAGPGGMGGPAGGMGFGFIMSGVPGQLIRADKPISQWSRTWLGYSSCDGIVLTQEDLDELVRGGNETAPVLASLWQYVETGGSLVVLPAERGKSSVPIPESWQRFRSERPGLIVFSPAFGRCLVPIGRDSARWPDGTFDLMRESFDSTARAIDAQSRTMAELNSSLAVVNDFSVPVRGLLALMILFTIVIGPVNLFLLSRQNRRIWMLWTVPVISFFTCMAVFGYMVVSEGWQGHAAVTGLTILDEVEKRATSLGRTGFYTPLTPSDGVHFSTETEVQPLGNEHSSNTSACAIDWTTDQHLTRGWVSARVPAHFLLRKSEARREGVKVSREGDSLVLVNRLGADIHVLHLADEKGQLYRAENIKAGERTVLTPRRAKIRPQPNAWRGLFTSSNPGKFAKEMPEKADEILLPRTYLAVVEGSPFLEQGLKGAAVTNLPSVVLGMMADLGS